MTIDKINRISNLFKKQAVRIVGLPGPDGKIVVKEHDEKPPVEKEEKEQTQKFDPFSIQPVVNSPVPVSQEKEQEQKQDVVVPKNLVIPQLKEPSTWYDPISKSRINLPEPEFKEDKKKTFLDTLNPAERLRIKELQIKGLSLNDAISTLEQERKDKKDYLKRRKALEKSIKETKEKAESTKPSGIEDEDFVNELHAELNAKYNINYSTLEYDKILRAFKAKDPDAVLDDVKKAEIKSLVDNYISNNIKDIAIPEQASVIKEELDQIGNKMDTLVQVSKLEAMYKKSAEEKFPRLWDYVANATNTLLQKYFPARAKELFSEYSSADLQEKKVIFEQYKKYLNDFIIRGESALTKIEKAQRAEESKNKKREYSETDIQALYEDNFALRLRDNKEDVNTAKTILANIAAFNNRITVEVDKALKFELAKIAPEIDLKNKTFGEYLASISSEFNKLKGAYEKEANKGDALFSTVLKEINKDIKQGPRISEENLGILAPETAEQKKEKLQEAKKEVGPAKAITSTLEKLIGDIKSKAKDDPRSAKEKADEALRIASEKYTAIKEKISTTNLTFAERPPSKRTVEKALEEGKEWKEITVPVSQPERDSAKAEVNAMIKDIDSKFSQTTFSLNFVKELIQELKETQLPQNISIQKKHEGLRTIIRSAFEQIKSYERYSASKGQTPVITADDLSKLLYKYRESNSKAFEDSGSKMKPVEFRTDQGIAYDLIPEQQDERRNPNVRKVWVLASAGSLGDQQAQEFKKLWAEKVKIENINYILKNKLSD